MNDRLPQDHDQRLQRALLSLDGLSVGDAFGQLLSTSARSVRKILERGALPASSWWHTDDSQMAAAVVETLAMVPPSGTGPANPAAGRISPDFLALRFVRRYLADPGRGYGKGARMQLEEMAQGKSWRQTSPAAFGGRGSMGNGSAMRSAPLGAYFADDPGLVVYESTKSSVITHSHPEGIAGSVAVSLAAAGAWNSRGETLEHSRASIWQYVTEHMPKGETRDGICKASAVPFEMMPENAARLLGSGFLVTAPDTVPFALWCALRHLDNYREALIATLEGDGDCDTNCAIVGGIVVLRSGREGIPAKWLASREPLPLELNPPKP